MRRTSICCWLHHNHCDNVRYGKYEPRAATTAALVKLYRTADQVPGKYEEIALLHSAGDYALTNEPRMYESIQKKAVEMEANGVILDAISEPSAGAKIASVFLGVSAARTGKAIAIYIYPPGEEPMVAQ